mmetsp:Transcript_19631/g.44354  ORF Transcript_19631/g.44354 Transcript_19631/m.44354 type:complete len:561 (-) Transcript_19631:69-1751(-)
MQMTPQNKLDDPKKKKEVSLAVSADVEQLEDPSASNVARRLGLLLSHVRPSVAHRDSDAHEVGSKSVSGHGSHSHGKVNFFSGIAQAIKLGTAKTDEAETFENPTHQQSLRAAISSFFQRPNSDDCCASDINAGNPTFKPFAFLSQSKSNATNGSDSQHPRKGSDPNQLDITPNGELVPPQDFKGPFLYGTENYPQHIAVIEIALLICASYLDDLENSFGPGEGERCDRRARDALGQLGLEYRERTERTDRHEAVTRLYHKSTGQVITDENRKRFIADGLMYNAVSNLCQSVAQEIMAEKCQLKWITVCDGKSVDGKPREPIRALVGRQSGLNHSHDTFLCVTGKGKVRAGIWSRHHLLTTGLEPATALPLLHDARDRGMNCVLVDPNCRGDEFGMETFSKTINTFFDNRCSRDKIVPSYVDGDIYVLAHSAAGGQLVRYLLGREDSSLTSRIRSVVFTDSTHSIQWLKKHPSLSSLMQSSKTLYIKSADLVRDDWENAHHGHCVKTDQWWHHRFGTVKTLWAGTTEHSLSNWYGHPLIFKHFDETRKSNRELQGGMQQT